MDVVDVMRSFVMAMIVVTMIVMAMIVCSHVCGGNCVPTYGERGAKDAFFLVPTVLFVSFVAT